jgi:uncharacterized protein
VEVPLNRSFEPGRFDTSHAAPGWYPAGDGYQWYWDGTAWTGDRAPLPPAGARSDETGMAIFAHLGGLIGSYLVPVVGGVIAPAIVYYSKKDESPFLRHHGAEALNWQISVLVYALVCLILVFVVIGFVLLPLLLIYDVVIVAMASIAAGGGRSYRYPVCIRFFR